MKRMDTDKSVQRALRKKARGPRAAGTLKVNFDECTEAGFFLLFQFMRQDEFAIKHVFHFAAQDVGKAAGHAGAKIEADRAENHGDTAGHVLAAVLADAFDHCNSTAVADGEAFADLSGDEEPARGGPVQHRVAGEHVAAFGSILAGADGDGIAGEAFADVIVSFPKKIQRETFGKKSSEALASGATEFVNGWGESWLLDA